MNEQKVIEENKMKTEANLMNEMKEAICNEGETL